MSERICIKLTYNTMYLTTNKIINMKKFNHPVLGHFIAEQFERAHLSIEAMRKEIQDRKSTRLNSSHYQQSRMPSSA